MVSVKKKPGQRDEDVIKAFSNKVREARIVEEVKRRKFYLKPSLARKARKKLKQEEASRMKIV